MNLSDRLIDKWVNWGDAMSDDLPMPAEHIGMKATRALYWARYREEKKRRWERMYGKYRVPWIDFIHFNAAVDAHYIRLIEESIMSLPTVLPPEPVPRLRRSRSWGGYQNE